MLDASKKTFYFALGFAAMLYLASCNPFAPGLEEIKVSREQVLGNRRYVDGLFKYFRNTYELKDTLLFGRMLSSDYRFTYFDFSNNNQIFWDRDIEMQSTLKMFRNVKSVNLIWNNYVIADTLSSDSIAEVERYFNLMIVQDEQTIFRSTGSARLRLKRKNNGEEWRITEWYDKSDF